MSNGFKCPPLFYFDPCQEYYSKVLSQNNYILENSLPIKTISDLRHSKILFSDLVFGFNRARKLRVDLVDPKEFVPSPKNWRSADEHSSKVRRCVSAWSRTGDEFHLFNSCYERSTDDRHANHSCSLLDVSHICRV